MDYGNAFFGDFSSTTNVFSAAHDFFNIIGKAVEFMSDLTGRCPVTVYVNPYILSMIEEELQLDNITELRDKKTGAHLEVEVDFNEPFFRFE